MERAEVFDAVAAAFVKAGGAVLAGRPATDDELERVHTDAHVRLISSTAGRAVMLDPDTFTSPESAEIARLAAGTAVEAAHLAFERGEAALVLVRPPGHHAERDSAMGFCLYNNVAVAAAAVRAAGAARVAIVDFDVHHGNGTQAIFYEDPAVFYASSHQSPFYPGTGASAETGAGPGLGTTLNVPLAAGTRNEGFLQAYRESLLPAVEAFRPDMLLVSAGFDAHERDPIAGMKMTTEGFEDLMTLIRGTADRVCGGRSMWIVEGGYHLGALRGCLDAAIRVLT
jgi:acetoin utilization deacetylase AcuC-like enzyme